MNLKLNDLAQRRILREWALAKLAEAHFWLNWYVNKQNYQFWGEDQPKSPMNSEKDHSFVRFMDWWHH